MLFASHEDIIENEKVIVNDNSKTKLDINTDSKSNFIRSKCSSPKSPTKNNSTILVPDINRLKSWNLFYPINKSNDSDNSDQTPLNSPTID